VQSCIALLLLPAAIAAVTVWQITDAVDRVACAHDDGWRYYPKYESLTAKGPLVNIKWKICLVLLDLQGKVPLSVVILQNSGENFFVPNV
jgi:hypothetical protein